MGDKLTSLFPNLDSVIKFHAATIVQPGPPDNAADCSQTKKEPELSFRLVIGNIISYVRAAGFFAAASRIVVRTLLGTCAKLNGSIEYEARPFESERIAVA